MSHNVVGWRYWKLEPGSSLLRSPFHDYMTWPSTTGYANCRMHRKDDGPDHNCTCGIYACRLVDLLYDMRLKFWIWRKLQRHIRSPGALNTTLLTPSQLLVAERDPAQLLGPFPTAVIGNVVVHGAKPYSAPVCPQSGCTCNRPLSRPEWCGSSATIKSLWVPPEFYDDAHSAVVASDLQTRYCVPVEVGYPEYVQADWAERIEYAGHLIPATLQYLATKCGVLVCPTYSQLGLIPP